MLSRDHRGRFQKSLLHVGDIVVLKGKTRLGITENKEYPVIATLLSAAKNRTYSNAFFTMEIKKPDQFFIKDDDGDVRMFLLFQHTRPEIDNVLGRWEILKCSKTQK